jgi:tetratricopeptide (TPR) repeat protein
MPRIIDRLIPILCMYWTISSASETDALADRVLHNALLTQYSLALAQAESLSVVDAPRGLFFTSMVLLSRYDDLGDTLALLKAKILLEREPLQDPFFESLRLFQMGYIQAELGSNVSAALTTRKAAKGFLGLASTDALGFYSIYQYYLDGSMAWVPFRTDKRPQMLATLEKARKESRWYWPLFSTSLTWIYFDRKEYKQALRVVEDALARYPNHPVFLQMKADMLFRMKRYREAADLYEQSATFYNTRAPLSVRWWSAAGNLVRIYHALQQQKQVEHWQAPFRKAQFQAIRPWLPASLLNDLAEKELLPL